LVISTILVPQGAEYGAVCRGLNQLAGKRPGVVALPVGVKPVNEYLETWLKSQDFGTKIQSEVLVMGLCGSLRQQYKVGDIVLYENCVYHQKRQECSYQLNTHIQSIVNSQPSTVNIIKSLTSDRIICSAAEKLDIGATMNVDVVDMEGFAVLDFFHKMGVEVAMLRVVSDDCHHDIPNLTTAINPNGSLKPLSLAKIFIQQPIAASRLIRGSLQALKVLEQVTKSLFYTPNFN
jgi:nucleoside phosphorylase